MGGILNGNILDMSRFKDKEEEKLSEFGRPRFSEEEE